MRYNIFYILVLFFVFNVQSQTCDFNQSENFDGGSPYSWGDGGGNSFITTTNNSAPYGWALQTTNKVALSRVQTGAWDLTGYNKITLSFDYITNCASGGGCKWNNGSDQIIVKYSTDGSSLINSSWSTTTAQTTWGSSGTIEIIDNFTATTYVVIDLIAGNGDFAVVDNIVMQACYNGPTDPTNLTATNFTENSFDTSWDPSTDVEGAVTYNVYKDAAIIATGVSSTSYPFTSLTANTTYNIGVEAVDSDGNTSAQTTKSFTTNKAPSSIESNFNGGTLTVGAGTAFTTNNITVGGGNVVVNSNSTNSGSFIVTGSVTSTSSDAFTYNRYIPDSNGRIISVPVSGQGVTAFVDNSANSLNTFGSFAALGMHQYQRAFGQRWEYYNPNAPGNFDSDFNVTKGYAVMRTQAGNMSFTGDFPTLSSNQISFNIEAFVGSGLQRWRSIGNPFMSYFPGTNTSASVDTFLKLNGSKLDDNYQALYLWDGSQWVIVNNLSNYSVAPGQGFLVKLKDFTATTLDFPQSYQTHQTSEVFYDRETERSKISLYVEKNKRVAKTEIYYIPSGTQGLDPGYDAAAYSTNKLDIQTRLIEESEDLNYAIQAISSFNYDEQVVPLSLTSQEDQKLKFSVEYESLPSELEIYLEDRQNNRFYNLKESSAVLKVAQGTNKYGRFYIHTKPLEFWIEDNSEDDSQDDNVFDLADGIASKAFDFFNLKDNILHFEGVNSKEQVKVNVFNLNGYKVFSTAEDLDTANNAIQLPYTLSEGVYIVELYRASGQKITKKIIVR